MNTIEKFKQAVDVNQANPLFAPMDDQILGDRIVGGFEQYISVDGHTCRRFIFDNGECFLFDTETETLYDEEIIPKEWFIHKFIEKIVYDFKKKYLIYLMEKDNEGNLVEPHMFATMDEIQLKGTIRLLPYRDDRILYVTNILLPPQLRGKGLGLKLIKDIFNVCQRLGYRLRLTEMVESFYNRMVSRDALVIASYDEVEITTKTELGLADIFAR